MDEDKGEDKEEEEDDDVHTQLLELRGADRSFEETGAMLHVGDSPPIGFSNRSLFRGPLGVPVPLTTR